MSRGNYVLTALLIFSASLAHADETPNDTPNAIAVAAADREPASVLPVNRFAIVVGYTQWNEKMKLRQPNLERKGNGTYAGPMIGVNYGRLLGENFEVNGTLGVAGGKATSGGFGTGTNFTDGTDRSWRSVFARASALYRIGKPFAIGLGLFARQVTVDWSATDPNVEIESNDGTVVGPSLDMKCQLSRHIMLQQSFAALSTHDNGMQWTWQLGWVL